MRIDAWRTGGNNVSAPRARRRWKETPTALRARLRSPINALATPKAVPLKTMAAIGINRVGFGPFSFRSCLSKFAAIASSLARFEVYDCFGADMVARADAAAFLSTNM